MIFGLTAVFAALAVAVIAAMLPIGAIVGAIGAVVGAIGIVPIAIAAGVAALVAGFMLAYNKVGWFRAGVDAAVGAVVAAFNWLKTAIGTAVVGGGRGS